MAVNPSALGPKPQLELSDGTPAVGNLLFFYVAGSVNTKQTTFTDSTGGSANTNPIVLNALGMPTTEIWWTQGLSYKVVYAPATDTDPPTSPIWTIDNLFGINDTTVSQDQWVSFVGTPTFVSATSFTLVGDQTGAFHVGRRIKTTNSGGTIYSTIISSVFGAVTTIVVANDSGSLDAGLSAVSYGLISAENTAEPSIGDVYVCQGRLTLTTAVPVTTADVTAAETVYFAPFRGNKLDLYDATALRWVRYKFTELTLDVPDATQMNDVFIYNNAGTLTLEAVAWTNDTTRATALVTQDGVLVKSGATGRRYLGSFYGTTAGNGQTEDSYAKRYLWNYYNRVSRPMKVVEATNTWSYTTAAFHQANASAANQLDYVQGVSEDYVEAYVEGIAVQTGATLTCNVGIGVDSTTVNSAVLNKIGYEATVVGAYTFPSAEYKGFPGVGRHTLVWLESSTTTTGTTTWYGDNNQPTLFQSGIIGELLG